MIAVIDYGVGNLFSLCSSLEAIGEKAIVTADKKEIQNADKLILPGVGAFRDAVEKLQKTGMADLVQEEVKKGKEILGICLGMQMLFDKSYEYGEYEGLRLLRGEVVSMQKRIPPTLPIPHIGWNALRFKKDSKLFKYIEDGDFVYFVHSYFATNCAESVTSCAEYGIELTASVESENVFGCQFHPEKSGKVGLNILKAFCEEKK